MGQFAAAAVDLDRFKGTQWETEYQGIYDEVLKTTTLTDPHSYFEAMLRYDLRTMKFQISRGETNHKKVLTDVDGKIALKLGWLKKLVPLQQAFEEELHKKANAKKRSYDETDGNAFDFDEDVAAASQEEQLKDRNRKEQERFEKGKPDKRKPHRWDQNLGYKPVMPRSSRPGGLFLGHAQKKNAEPGARGSILLERAERSRAERSRAGSGDVFEQSAPYQPLRKERRRDGERSDLNGVRIAPPAEVSRPPLAARSRVSESEKDGEWRPSSAAAADSSPPPRTSVGRP